MLLVAGSVGIAGRRALDLRHPEVDRATLWIATAESKAMLREISASGSLVTRDEQWITAVTQGRVDTIESAPGQRVEPDSVIAQLVNPELSLGVLQAESELATEKSNLAELRANLAMQVLSQKAELVDLQGKSRAAQRAFESAQMLVSTAAISNAELVASRETCAALEARLDIENQRLTLLGHAQRARVRARENRVQRLQAMVDFEREQHQRLRIKAGRSGVIREFLVATGEWITPGKVIAIVIQPEQLIARLQLPQSMAEDIDLDLGVRVQLPQGKVRGVVTRIDPAVSEGRIQIDVEFEEALPPGSRPDLSVTGVVELERIAQALQIRRPARARSHAKLHIFRLDDTSGNTTATRIEVHTGRSALDHIEIKRGLQAGDEVIVSDMSAWDNVDVVTIK